MQFEFESKCRSCRILRFRLVRKFLKIVSKLWHRIWGSKPKPLGVTLGRYVKGNGAGALWMEPEGQVVLPLDQLRRHVVILESSPQGEDSATATLIRGIAREDRRAQILVFDTYIDQEISALFGTPLVETGRQQPFFFPQQPFNAWAGGDWRLVSDRLLEVTPPGGDPAMWCTSVAHRLVELACGLNGKPPRSHEELLERLKYRTLLAAYGEEALLGIDKKDVANVRIRYGAFFASRARGSALDGEKAFADLDAAYFSIGALTIGEHAAKVILRMLLSQLLAYTRYEKDPNRLCVVFIRVPAVLASDGYLTALIEQARGQGVAVVLILPTLAEAGDSVQIRRILGSTGTLIAHRYPLCPELEGGIFRKSVEAITDPVSRMLPSASQISRGDLLEMPPKRVLVISKGTAALVDLV
jgi:hypothetical protein